MELQLFNGKPTAAGPITQTHSTSIILNNGLWFPVNLLVTQLPEIIPIVLGLPWLRDVNPDIDWKNLTMKFPEPGACLATVHLRLQLTLTPMMQISPLNPLRTDIYFSSLVTLLTTSTAPKSTPRLTSALAITTSA
ncbi:hypothetical protein C0993_005740 [Termitomyces sp. T159_Od127]|nr:hypothetical protein C0993_005740 [Termitomyces sp. T159_Od127]